MSERFVVQTSAIALCGSVVNLQGHVGARRSRRHRLQQAGKHPRCIADFVSRLRRVWISPMLAREPTAGSHADACRRQVRCTAGGRSRISSSKLQSARNQMKSASSACIGLAIVLNAPEPVLVSTVQLCGDFTPRRRTKRTPLRGPIKQLLCRL